MELKIGMVVQTAGRVLGYNASVFDLDHSFFFPPGTLLTIARLEVDNGAVKIFRAEPLEGPGWTLIREWQIPKEFEEVPPLVVLAMAAKD